MKPGLISLSLRRRGKLYLPSVWSFRKERSTTTLAILVCLVFFHLTVRLPPSKMRALVIAVIAVALCAASANAAAAKCHNITGTCFEHGFQCANDEIVPHSKRCNGVEDCADGTDEFIAR